MDNILLTVVGDRDPYGYWSLHEEPVSVADTPIVNTGAIVQFVYLLEQENNWKYLWPSKIILLSVEEKGKKTKTRVSLLEEYLTTKGINVEHRPLAVKDPTDYGALIAEMGKVSADVEKANPNSRLRVLTSPGTPQMLAAWLVLGNEGRLKADFFQKREGDEVRDEVTGKFLHKTVGTINRVKFEAVFEAEAIKSALSMFRRYDFVGAYEQFKRLQNSSNNYRASVCGYFASVCEAFSSWEIFDYAAALEKVKSLKIPRDDGQEMLAAFEANVLSPCETILTDIVKGNLQSVVIDVFCSAERALYSGRHLDCIWRCMTAYEVMLRKTIIKYELKKAPGRKNDYGDVPEMETRLQGNSVTSKQLDGTPDPHPGMIRLVEQSLLEPLGLVRRQRNDMLHYGQAIKESGRAVDVTRRAISLFFDIPVNEINAYSMSRASITSLASNISALLQRHP